MSEGVFFFLGGGGSLGKTVSRETNHVDAHSELGNAQQRGALGGGGGS